MVPPGSWRRVRRSARNNRTCSSDIQQRRRIGNEQSQANPRHVVIQHLEFTVINAIADELSATSPSVPTQEGQPGDDKSGPLPSIRGFQVSCHTSPSLGART
jgi:hypothetical protein